MAGTQGEDDEPVASDLPILIRPEAEAEIQEAFLYCEDKAEGLGIEFLRMVDASLASMARHPGMYATVHKEVRRAVLRRFPYSLFFVAEETRLVVIACFHSRRNPKEWKRRV